MQAELEKRAAQSQLARIHMGLLSSESVIHQSKAYMSLTILFT